jgi:hypothetical protein
MEEMVLVPQVPPQIQILAAVAVVVPIYLKVREVLVLQVLLL